MGDEVIITYETLFELYRREKSRGELQELDKSFFSDVVEYLIQKKAVLDNSISSDNIFAENERMKAEKQLLNIKKILGMLYELRTRKIVDMAWIKSRDPGFFIDDSTILPEEKPIYYNIISIFNNNRANVLLNILNLKQPIIEDVDLNSLPIKPNKEVDDDKEGTQEEGVKIELIEDTPEFVGDDMDLIGPFSKGEVIKLPKRIADILLEKNLAKSLSEY